MVRGKYVASTTALRQQTAADTAYNVQGIDQWRPEGLSNGRTGRVG
jgi:hypothetical protein